MEETNYYRQLSPKIKANTDSGASPSTYTYQADDMGNKETNGNSDVNDLDPTDVKIPTFDDQKTKSYLSKLKVFNRKALRYPNRMVGMAIRPLIFLTFPVIFYSGLSYGSNLIWFNVLNGTASLILSEEPYDFSSSVVGLCYFAPLIGVILGSVSWNADRKHL